MFVIPTIRYGGAELFLLRLCALARQNYEISLVVIGNREGLCKEFEALDIKIHYLGFKSVIYFPLAYLKLRREIKREFPDIIQSFLYQADILSGLASAGQRIKLRIWSLRGAALAAGTSYHKLFIQRVATVLAAKIPNLIIACSNEVRDFHIQLGYPDRKIITIGNFVSSWTHQVKSKSIFLTEYQPTHFKIGLAARYDLGKGHRALLLAVLDFLRKNPNVSITLCFAGKGCNTGGRLSVDFHPILNQTSFIETNRLRIITSGLLSGVDLVNWFQNLDLYFMASDSLEGFPNSLAEAITIGLPSLATPIGAAREFLSGDRLSEKATFTSMSELLGRFYGEDVDNKQEVTKCLKEKMLVTYQDDKILAAYNSVWKIQG